MADITSTDHLSALTLPRFWQRGIPSLCLSPTYWGYGITEVYGFRAEIIHNVINQS